MDSALPMPPLWVATDAALSARLRRGDALVAGVGEDPLSQTSCVLALSSHFRPSSGSFTEQ